MNLEFKQFQKKYYSEYAAWFTDYELNRRLGPMDYDWLDAVLSELESESVTWAVFRGAELVAVVETAFALQNRSSAVIAAVATKPALRRQGIGTAVLRHLLALHKSRGIAEHIAYISIDNPAARRFMEKAGFVSVTSEPDEHGYVEFRQRQGTADV